MSSATAKLITEFEALATEEKQVFVKEIFLRLPPFDSGVLNDDEVARAGDDLSAMLAEEENASQPR